MELQKYKEQEQEKRTRQTAHGKNNDANTYGLRIGIKMKIKELLESLSEVKKYISEIRINGYKFDSFNEHRICKELGIDGDKLEVENWKVSLEGYKAILIIHTVEYQYSEKKEENTEDELTVSNILENIYFDDENTIIIYNRYNGKMYSSDNDDVFVLCELLCLDVKEYVQIHKGKHQTIEIHLK